MAFRRRISSLTMPLCTGLPPGELMRSTTACAPASSKALRSAETSSSALASLSAAISPRTSTSAVCGVLGAVGADAVATAAPRPRPAPGPARPGGRRCASGARCAAGAAVRVPALERGFERRAPQRPARRGAAGGGRGPGVGGTVGGSSWGSWGAFGAAGASKGTGRMSREGYQYTWPSLLLHVRRPSAGRGRRARRRSGRRPARRSAPWIEQRIQRLSASRNSPGCQSISVGTCDAAVQVGAQPAVEAQREGARRAAVLQHVEDPGPAAFVEVGRRRTAARPARYRSRLLSACCQQPVVQFARAVRHEQRAEGVEGLACRARRSSPPRARCRR